MPINLDCHIQTSHSILELSGSLPAIFGGGRLKDAAFYFDGITASVLDFPLDDQPWFSSVTGVKPNFTIQFAANGLDFNAFLDKSVSAIIRLVQTLSSPAVLALDTGEVILIYARGRFILNSSWSTSPQLSSAYPYMELGTLPAL